MGFPSKSDIKKISKKLEEVDGTFMISEKPTPLEKLRWEACQKFISYKRKNKITQKELAKKMGVDEAKVSKILRHKIDEFTTDRLLNLLYKIDCNFSLEFVDVA